VSWPFAYLWMTPNSRRPHSSSPPRTEIGSVPIRQRRNGAGRRRSWWPASESCSHNRRPGRGTHADRVGQVRRKAEHEWEHKQSLAERHCPSRGAKRTPIAEPCQRRKREAALKRKSVRRPWESRRRQQQSPPIARSLVGPSGRRDRKYPVEVSAEDFLADVLLGPQFVECGALCPVDHAAPASRKV